MTAKYLYDPGLKHKQYNIRVATTQSKGKDSKEEENERKWVYQYDTAMCSNVATVRGQWEEPWELSQYSESATGWIIRRSIHGRGIYLLQNVQTDSAMPPASYQWLMGVTILYNH